MPGPDTTSLGAFFVSFFSPTDGKPKDNKLLVAYKEALSQAQAVLRECKEEIMGEPQSRSEQEAKDLSDFVECEDYTDAEQEPRRGCSEAAVTYEDLLKSLEADEKPPPAPLESLSGSKVESAHPQEKALSGSKVESAHPQGEAHQSPRLEDQSQPARAEGAGGGGSDTECDWDPCDDELSDCASNGEWEMVPSGNLTEPMGPSSVRADFPSELLCRASSRATLRQALPSSLHSKRWQLLYATYNTSSSLKELCSSIWHGDTAVLLVVQDTKGVVFGGFHSSSSSHKYVQEVECSNFVYSEDADELRVFHASGSETVVHALDDSVAFGVLPDDLALWLDWDMVEGLSMPCPAFGTTKSLASQTQFTVSDAEVWGFC